MTVEEFRETIRQQRREMRHVVFACGLLAIAVGCAVLYWRQAALFLASYIAFPLALIGYVAMIAPFVVYFARTFWRAARTIVRYPGLCCRHCRTSLYFRARGVIATNKCGRCGERVLNTEPD
jgi:hypothetical protein